MACAPSTIDAPFAAMANRRSRAWIAIIGLAITATAVVAGTGQADTADALTTAKEQLDLLRSDANAAKAGTEAGTPQVALPELHTTETDNAAPAILAPVVPGNAAKTGSNNWLVDAMAKPDRAADPRHAFERPDDKQRSPGEPADKRDSEEARGTRNERVGESTTQDSSAHPSASPDPVFNPLTRYMSSWLAPQDYALLRRTMDDRLTGTGRDTPAMAPPGTVPEEGSLQSALAGMDIGSASADRGPALGDKPPANPYLEALNLPDRAPSVPNPAPPVQPAYNPPPALPSPANEAVTPKPVIPDFVKSAEDDKYFKPLKRF